MKSVIFTLLFVNIFIFLCEAKEPALKPSILFIPLDARPPCLKMTKKMGLIGNAELISRPMSILGNSKARKFKGFQCLDIAARSGTYCLFLSRFVTRIRNSQ